MKLSHSTPSGFKFVAAVAAFPETMGSFYTNEELVDKLLGGKNPPISENRIFELGFQNRFWVNEGVDSVDLMEAALTSALKKSAMAKEEISMLITVTTTSPCYTTSTAALLSGRLAISCPGFELKTGCASAIYAIQIAARLLSQEVPVIAIAFGETLSKIVDIRSKYAFAAGDAGGALILNYCDKGEFGLKWGVLGMEGKYSHMTGVPGILPPEEESLINGAYFIQYDPELNKVLSEKWKSLAHIIESELPMKKVDHVIFHQANAAMGQVFMDGFSREMNFISSLSHSANTGSVSTIICLDELFDSTHLGKELVIAAVGGGISYGAVHIKLQ